MSDDSVEWNETCKFDEKEKENAVKDGEEGHNNL